MIRLASAFGAQSYIRSATRYICQTNDEWTGEEAMVAPSFLLNPLAVGVAAAASFAATFVQMDSNPTLFLYDR